MLRMKISIEDDLKFRSQITNLLEKLKSPPSLELLTVIEFIHKYK